jgi:hypothetical protein
MKYRPQNVGIKKYLNKAMLDYVYKEKFNPEAAFKLINGVGGLQMLAHPI